MRHTSGPKRIGTWYCVDVEHEDGEGWTEEAFTSQEDRAAWLATAPVVRIGQLQESPRYE